MFEPVARSPVFDDGPFKCPHADCGVLASHSFFNLHHERGRQTVPPAHRSTCRSCGQHSYWVDKTLVWPRLRRGPNPSPDFTKTQLQLYEEARAIAADSPRAAAALLRVLVETQIVELDPTGDTGERLVDKVKRLRKEGIVADFVIEQMEAVRLTGNQALHPGEIDTSDTVASEDDTVDLLFYLALSIVLMTKTLAARAADIRKKHLEARTRSRRSES